MQKMAYKLRISYWSSDVCSSDLFGYLYPLLEDAVALIPEKVNHKIYPSVEQPALNAEVRFDSPLQGQVIRSEERRVGQGCVSTCSTRGAAKRKQQKTQHHNTPNTNRNLITHT